MPYSVFQIGAEIFIPAERCEECLEKIHAFHRSVVPNIQVPGGPESHLAKSSLGKLTLAIKHFGWNAIDTDDGVLVGVAESQLGDARIFAFIAPCVEPGSELEYIGEDGLAWKHSFDGASVVSLVGRIAYAKGDDVDDQFRVLDEGGPRSPHKIKTAPPK